jgi:hypothetical protein
VGRRIEKTRRLVNPRRLTLGAVPGSCSKPFNVKGKEIAMASVDEQILRAAKEIAVKFIEMGRLSPNAFSDFFREIYRTIEDTVKGNPAPGDTPPSEPPAKD